MEIQRQKLAQFQWNWLLRLATWALISENEDYKNHNAIDPTQDLWISKMLGSKWKFSADRIFFLSANKIHIEKVEFIYSSWTLRARP